MTRIVLVALTALSLLTLSVAGPALAKGAPGVANGIHNLSATGVDPFFGTPGSSFYATDEDEICVFCHAPHGGSLTGPLWNRNNPASAWTHYSSPTLSSYMQGLAIGRAVSNESLLCMSCHDGSISVNHLINPPNDRVAPILTTFNNNPNTEIIDIFGSVGARIGGSPGNTAGTGDLSDDHPISFSYDSVLASAEYQPAGSKFGELRDVATASAYAGEGVRFYGAGNRVECSSCHDPHVDYLADNQYSPFLIMPNSGSNLCLACHNK